MNGDCLLEIVIDLGRPAQARFPGEVVELSRLPVACSDLEHVVAAIGEFSEDNRAGIESTLPRISALRNRRGEIIGLTLRVGRAVFGTIDLIQDLVEGGNSILLLGRPGVGKTTKLLETARARAPKTALMIEALRRSELCVILGRRRAACPWEARPAPCGRPQHAKQGATTRGQYGSKNHNPNGSAGALVFGYWRHAGGANSG